jgi:SAM-dependent methyltransferase
MEYSFPRYLLAKQAIDDRALNRQVLDALRANLPVTPTRVIEVGAGMGNMLARLLGWNVLKCVDYVHVDSMPENIAFALEWIPEWAAKDGMRVERAGASELHLYDAVRDVSVRLEQADVTEFIERKPMPGDLLIAHAFLDLLPMPESMPKLLTLTRDLAWLTVNFDGVTSFEPTVDAALDNKIERLYHTTMDTRPTGGDSRAGRHLFSHLRAAGADILAAGGSDWVVFAHNGQYLPDEAYFLHFILHFLEESLPGDPELDPTEFGRWLDERRGQIERGQLVYIAHQMDFLARTAH